MALKIVYLSALPRDQDPIRVEKEYKTIEMAIRGSVYRDQICLINWPGISLQEFQSVLEKEKPDVLHFSGHATKVGNLVFQGLEDESQRVPKDPFTMAFKLLGTKLKLVVLSSCYSKDQAERILPHVDRVIGTDRKLEDDKAIEFSQKFYESIGNGKSIEIAFDKASNQLDLVKKGGEDIPNTVILKNPSYPDSLDLFETSSTTLNAYLHDKMSDFSKELNITQDGKGTFTEDRKAIFLTADKWNMPDEEIIQRFEERVKEIDIIVDEFVTEPPDYGRLVIGASYGSGKSFVLKSIFIKYAKQYLNNSYKTKLHIPIFVELHKGLSGIYESQSLDWFLNNVVLKKDNKILLLLDDLDEYTNIIELFEKLDADFSSYKNIKVIFTTRLNIEYKIKYSKQLGIEKGYVRLLPLTKKQVEDFFASHNINLSFEQALDLGIRSQELTHLSLLSKLIEIFPIIESLKLIKEDTSITTEMYQAFFYLHFIHDEIEKKEISKDLTLSKRKSSYAKEKNFLISVSILHQAYEGKLNQETIDNYKSHLKLQHDTSDFGNMLSTYFFSSNDEEFLEFNNKTYKEFLIAEKYLEILVKDTELIWLMNASIPTELTINFLKGLIQMMKSSNNEMRRCIEYSKEGGTSLLNSFDCQISVEEAIDTIVSNATINVYSENSVNAILFNVNEKEQNKNVNGKDLLKYPQIPFNKYENLMLYRWISLYISNTLDPDNNNTKKQIKKKDKEEQEKLVTLLKSNNRIPGYVKNLSKIDLSLSDLSGANLSRSNLSVANLTKAILSEANLSEADLSGSTLLGATLTKANLTGANLSDVILTRANLSEADLSTGANLTRANLSEADLSEADLSRSTFIDAILTPKSNLTPKVNLSEANLTGANLTGANLTGATLIGTILSDANLSEADLSYSRIFATYRYENLICKNTNFNEAQINNESFINYLIKNQAKNIVKIVL
jgi:uncharacterized protein YjbI with pentapeptide repeats